MTSVQWDESPRSLTDDEINNIINAIRFSTDPNPVQKHILKIHHEKISKKLKTVKILPSKINELKKIIVNEFYKSVVPYGEAVGVNSSQCIGEPVTQLSTVKTDRVIVYSPFTKEFYNGPIGEFVDKIMNNHPVHILHNDSEITTFDKNNQHFIMTVNPENEKCYWMSLCEVSRHPTKGDLVKVTTKSGRSCTTTLSHSHLKRTHEGKIVPIVAKNLRKGDYIPVVKKLPHFEEIDEIQIGDKMEKLDFELGWFIGWYLAESSTNTSVSFVNIAINFSKRSKNLLERFGNPNYATYFTCPSSLNEFICNHFYKTETNNKHIAAWVYFTPLEFIKGILCGYFDKDGFLSENKIIFNWSTNKIIIEDISLLLSIFSIFGIINKKTNLYNIVLHGKDINIFYKQIGTCCYNKKKEFLGILYNNESIHETDKIPETQQIVKHIAEILNIPFNSNIDSNDNTSNRKTIEKYYELFNEKVIHMNLEEELEDKLKLLKQVLDSNIIWDEIVEIEIIDDPKELVYDFGVQGHHTFMINAGIFVHNTLNSVAPWEKILFVNYNGETSVVKIGEWIDELLKNNVKDIVHIPKNRTQYLELKTPVLTPTPTNKGVVNWDAITAVTKHLPVGNLVRITTKSGRSVTVTRCKSILVWKNNELVAKNGADVKLGDLCPVMLNFPEFEKQITHVKLIKYLSPKEWIYGTELMKLYNSWANVKSGIIYPNQNIGSVESTIPEEIELTEELGIIMGLYLADGWATKTFVGISNNCDEIQSLIKNWCDKYNITYHKVITESKSFPHAKSTDLKIHSVIIACWFKEWMGTGSANKNMPMEAFNGTLDFAKGLLNGYFAGDGCVSKKDGKLLVCSVSENLILGFSTLCTRFGIFGEKSGRQQTKNNVNSTNIKYSYTIRNNFVKKWAKKIGCCHPQKKEIMDSFLDYNYQYPYGLLQEYVNDINLDPIVKIEDVPATEYVYDVTVPTTKNFTLFNGLACFDTFHHTGQSTKNVTLGFPRARELFNSTRTPANPSCTIYFMNKNKNPQDLHPYIDKLTQATIDNLLLSWSIKDPESYILEYWHKIWFKLNDDFGDLTINDWCMRLKFNVEKLYKHNLTVKEIALKLLNIYDEIRCIPSPLNLGILDIIVDCKNISDNERKVYMTKIVAPKIRGQLICGIPGISKIYVRKAKVDESFGGYPLKPHIQERLTDTEEWIVDTEGTNLSEILIQPGVDSYRTMSNDMWEIQSLFGIEAARIYLFLEFMNVVLSGGIKINPVHVQVLVDKMCYTGSIRAIARFGIETSQYDPIARATFEEVLSQIITSAIFSEKDNLNGISSNIVLGNKINAGTGAVILDDIPLNVKKNS